MNGVKSEQQPAQTPPQKLSRRRKEKKPLIFANEVRALGWYLFLVLLLVAGFVFLFNPLKIYTEQGGLLPQPRVFFRFIAFAGGTYLVSLLLFAVAGAVGWWRMWARRVKDEAFWNTTCPSCESAELKRVERTTTDRWLNRLDIPVRRYICGACKWQGRRVDSRKV